jgi:hypothetical protein
MMKLITKIKKSEGSSKSTVKGKIISSVKSELKAIDKLDVYSLDEDLTINSEYYNSLNTLM